MNWHDTASVLLEWEDADQVNDLLIDQLIIAARDAVIAYAPALPPLEDGQTEDDRTNVPERYRVAQLIQIRNLWNASLATGNGDLGGETYTFTPRPLDWHVKALLRPAHGRPRVR